MNEELSQIKAELKSQRELLESIFRSAEKTRKYFMWTLIVTVVLFVLPLIGLAFVIPTFISTYTSTLSGLGV